jgi:lysozyme family protein
VKDNFEQCLAFVLKHEGGYVNNLKDPGGMTNLGVTKRVYEAYVGHPVDEVTMRSLTPEMVEPIYKINYWDACHCDNLPDGVDYAVFDFAVNSGTRRAIKVMQKCAGVADDGVIGPATMRAVSECNPRHLASDICEARLAFLQALPIWDTFGKGWSRRVTEVEQMAFNMVG